MDYTEIYNGDRYCLMCRHVCPVERMTKREATSPHGWALLIASVQRGLTGWNAETVDTLYQCADCGLCQANCVSDRPLPYAIVAARASVVEQGAMPPSVERLDAVLRSGGNPYATTIAPLAENATYPVSSNNGAGEAIGLYSGAGVASRGGGAVRAAETLMRAAGFNPVLLDANRSSVYLPYTVGLWDTARTLARQTLEEMRQAGIQEVVTLSRQDTHAFMHIYPELGIALPDGLRVREFTEWLLAMLEGGKLRLRQSELDGAVYHDPCQTPRIKDSGAAARKVLAAVTGASAGEMFWRGNQAQPCGAVGGFEFTQPWLAEKLARTRLTDATEAGAKLIVTEDPQCAAHLAQYAGEVPVVNLIEFVAENVVTDDRR